MRRRWLGLGAAIGGAAALATWWALREPVAPPRPRPPPLQSAQATSELRAEITAINQAYAALDALSAKVRVEVRRDDGGGEVLEVQAGDLLMAQGRTWWTLGDTHVLSTPEEHLTVYDEAKVLVARDPLDAPPSIHDAAAFSDALQELVRDCPRAELSAPGFDRTITLTCPGSAYSRVEVRFGPDHLITSLVLAVPPRPAVADGAPLAMTMTWSDVDRSPTEVPPLAAALLGRDGGPREDLAGYRLVDLRAAAAVR